MLKRKKDPAHCSSWLLFPTQGQGGEGYLQYGTAAVIEREDQIGIYY